MISGMVYVYKYMFGDIASTHGWMQCRDHIMWVICSMCVSWHIPLYVPSMPCQIPWYLKGFGYVIKHVYVYIYIYTYTNCSSICYPDISKTFHYLHDAVHSSLTHTHICIHLHIAHTDNIPYMYIYIYIYKHICILARYV